MSRREWRLVERANHLAVHGIFSSAESAERHLAETIPVHVERRYFTDKALRPEDFIILPPVVP